MISKIIIASMMLLPVTAIGQVNIDSLWTVWNDTTQPDTIRLKAIDDFTQ